MTPREIIAAEIAAEPGPVALHRAKRILAAFAAGGFVVLPSDTVTNAANLLEMKGFPLFAEHLRSLVAAAEEAAP